MSDGAGSVKAGFRQPGAFRAADSENDRDALSETWASRDAARLQGRAKERLAAALGERQHGVTEVKGTRCLSKMLVDKGREVGCTGEWSTEEGGRDAGRSEEREGEAKGRTGEEGRGMTQDVEHGEETHRRDGRDVGGYRRSL